MDEIVDETLFESDCPRCGSELYPDIERDCPGGVFHAARCSECDWQGSARFTDAIEEQIDENFHHTPGFSPDYEETRIGEEDDGDYD